MCFGILVFFFFKKQKRPSRRRPAIALAYINKTLLQFVLDMTWTLKLPWSCNQPSKKLRTKIEEIAEILLQHVRTRRQTPSVAMAIKSWSFYIIAAGVTKAVLLGDIKALVPWPLYVIRPRLPPRCCYCPSTKVRGSNVFSRVCVCQSVRGGGGRVECDHCERVQTCLLGVHLPVQAAHPTKWYPRLPLILQGHPCPSLPHPRQFQLAHLDLIIQETPQTCSDLFI